MSGIYMIVNKETGKFYLGSAVNFEARWRVHKSQLRNGKHHSPHLQRSWNKYGEEKFDFTIVKEVERGELLAVEQFYLDLLRPYDTTIGYNISESATGCGLSGEKNPNFGKAMPKEQREKIATTLRGHPVSAETRLKISQNTPRQTGALNHNYGRSVSDERRKAHSEKMKGRYAGENNPCFGKHPSEETRIKMSISRKGKTGALCSNSKRVYQYTKDMSLVSEYVSATEASAQTGINNSNISACCLGKLKWTGGFIWRYADQQERVSV